jgi:hypothetical protein
MNKINQALHDLICNSLRESHIEKMSLESLKTYNYKLGVALHNIPHLLTMNGELPLTSLVEVNELDPSGSIENWGTWARQLCTTIEQDIPKSPLIVFAID